MIIGFNVEFGFRSFGLNDVRINEGWFELGIFYDFLGYVRNIYVFIIEIVIYYDCLFKYYLK